MKKWLTLLALSFILSINSAYAVELATILRGKIVTTNPAGVQVLITEKDGSILDMTSISSAGVYNLDLTIMDTPSKSEVKELILEVKNKTGAKRKFKLNNYLLSFGDTVLLKPIIFK